MADLVPKQNMSVTAKEPLAPWPAIDRFPTVIGAGLTLGYISSVFRLCLTGYRQQYVDLLDELLEKDPHAFAVIQKRVLAVGQGKVTFTPPEGLEAGEKEIAEECAAWVQGEWNGIPSTRTAVTQLAWGLYYAVAALEKMCVRNPDGSLSVTSFEFVHYRRLSFPDPWKWDLYIWDQGLVQGPAYGLAPTQGVYGLNIEKIRDKYVVHTPQVRGSYPTRDGIGREIAYWMALKLIATRLAPQYLERFAIPFADITFNTKGPDDKNPRIAGKSGSAGGNDDIDGANAAAVALGSGALSRWVHSDAVSLEFKTHEAGSPKLTFAEWITISNTEMSKAASGGTLTTEVTHAGGNRALGQTQNKNEEKLYAYDAGVMGDTLKRDYSDFMVENNPRYRGLPKRLFPVCKVLVNEEPDPNDVVERAVNMAKGGAPVDADATATKAGVALVPNPDPTKPRRMFPLLGSNMNPAPHVIGLDDEEDVVQPPAPQAPGKPGEEPTEPPAKGAPTKPTPPKKPAGRPARPAAKTATKTTKPAKKKA